MVRTQPRAVILGIDGGSLDLIEPLVAEGSLPSLGKLLGESLHGPTTTTWPAHTAPDRLVAFVALTAPTTPPTAAPTQCRQQQQQHPE